MCMKNSHPIIIVGAGPAGCQCALWLTMLGYNVLIIEQSHQIGGLLASNPYPSNWTIGTISKSGQDIAHVIQQHIKEMKIPVWLNANITQLKQDAAGFTLIIDDKPISTSYVVIATGVKPRTDNLTASQKILTGPGDAIFEYDFANKRVAILGGGDNAAENYIFIKNKQAKICHLFVRTIRARKQLWNEVDKEDVFFSPYSIDQDNVTITHANKVKQYDVIVVLYGWEANVPAFLIPYKNELLTLNGFFITDKHCRTPIKNMFAIGEVANRMHPCIVTSMADGVVAAKAIQTDMENNNAI